VLLRYPTQRNEGGGEVVRKVEGVGMEEEEEEE